MTTDSNPPAEVTTPPDGYEWTGEVRTLKTGDDWAYWEDGVWKVDKWSLRRASVKAYPILREIKPQTVDLIGLPIEAARELAHWWTHSRLSWGVSASEIARKAVEECEQSC